MIAYALSEPAALDPAEALPPVQRGIPEPVLFGTVGPGLEVEQTSSRLRAAGIFVAHSPEALASAACALSRDAARQARISREPGREAPRRALPVPAPPDEATAKQLLAELGVAAPRRFVCETHAEAHEALRRLERPVVAKILAAEIAHKTEVGGVCLHIADAADLDRALARLDAIAVVSPRRYLLEEMAPPGLELIVSASRDASFGPYVMVGLGGVLAEALRDTATRLAPLSVAVAHEMLEQLRAAPLFDGWRGSEKLDRDAVAHALVALGDLLCGEPAVQELEINPLRVYPRGVLALDALLQITAAAAPPSLQGSSALPPDGIRASKPVTT